MSSRRSTLAFIAAAGTAFVALAWLERRRPLRRRVEGEAEHTGRNLAVLATTVITTAAVERIVLTPLQSKLDETRYGIVRVLPLSPRVRRWVAVLLLDYSLWWWHWMNHRVPNLWRFHLVHHIDRDLDASTGLRFHFGEMMLSVFFRALQVTVIGADAETLAIWQRLLISSVVFHHSNLRLSPELDRMLTHVLVTPRMHGIHHSTRLEETDSNWSSLFSFWDTMHGTMRLDVPQEAITIGVPAWQEDEDVRLPKILAAPFERQRDDWLLGDADREDRPRKSGFGERLGEGQ